MRYLGKVFPHNVLSSITPPEILVTFNDYSSFTGFTGGTRPILSLARIVTFESSFVGTLWRTSELLTHPHLDTNLKLAIHLGRGSSHMERQVSVRFQR